MADKRQDQPPQSSPQEGSREAPPFWEWVAAAAGLLLVAASMGVLGYYAWAAESGERPQPSVQVVAIERQPAGWLVAVQVRNRSQTTAAALRVTGRLRQGPDVLEERGLELKYLPGGSSREGGLFFSRDPRSHRLEWVFESYEKP